MTAKYLRCENCGRDFPEGASDYKDGYKLEQDAVAAGWLIFKPHGDSLYTHEHYCMRCADARPLR